MLNKSSRSCLNHKVATCLPLILLLLLVRQTTQAQGFRLKNFSGQLSDEYSKTIFPILEEHCSGCHDPGNMQGLDFLSTESEDDLPAMRGIFASVVEQMKNHKMPPGDDISLTEEDRKTVVDWLNGHLKIKAAEYDRVSQYVVCVFEASNGDLWFGTVNEGVARFDGQSYTYFTTKDGLPHNTVTSVAEDQQGQLWFGTHNGIGKYADQKFETVGAKLGLPTEGGSVFVDKTGTVWASMDHGVYKLDGDTFTELKLPIDKSKISTYAIIAGRATIQMQDRDGNLWLGTDGYGALKYDGKSFQRYSTDDGLCSNNVNDIVEDAQGNIWFACMQSYQPEMTEDGGLCRYDGKSITRFADIKGLANKDLYTIYRTRSGDIWIGATGVGAYRFDGKEFILFSETDRPHWTRNFGVQDIAEDRRGNLWFGFSGGLYRFNGQSFENTTGDQLIKNHKFTDAEKPEQENVQPITVLSTPENWGSEQIPFPLGFAPTIPFTGNEDIRFAPGWSDDKSPEFWTYKFVWLINEDPKLDEDKISRLLVTYFDGLCGTVNRSRNDSAADLQPSTATFTKQDSGFQGRLRIFDAFRTQEWINLNAKVSTSKIFSDKFGQRHVIEFEFSPQDFEHPVWDKLKEIKLESDSKN